MQRWCEALIADGNFRQQADPLDGRFTRGGPAGYSPAALVMMDFTWRLAGICESGRQLHWHIRPGHAASRGARFSRRTDTRHRAQMTYDASGADLKLDGRWIGRLEGGAARLITGESGQLLALGAIDERMQELRLLVPDRPARKLSLGPQDQISLN
jgi:hypothetical protein